jgi:hypothetical protein
MVCTQTKRWVLWLLKRRPAKAGGFFVAMKLRTKKGGLQPMMVQEERGNAEATLQRLGAAGLRETEYELAFFTESARIYWRMWGPLGEPMLRNLDSWAQMQRDYFQRARELPEADVVRPSK